MPSWSCINRSIAARSLEVARGRPLGLALQYLLEVVGGLFVFAGGGEHLRDDHSRLRVVGVIPQPPPGRLFGALAVIHRADDATEKLRLGWLVHWRRETDQAAGG